MKMKRNKIQNVYSLRYFYFYASFFGIVPKFDFKCLQENRNQKTVNKIHFFILLLCIPTATLMSFILNMETFLSTRFDVTFLEITTSMILIANSFVVLMETCKNQKLWRNFMLNLMRFDQNLYIVKGTFFKKWFELIIFHLCYVSIYIYDFKAWFNCIILDYLPWLPFRTSWYFMFLSSHVICIFAQVINDRLKYIREANKISTIISSFKTMKSTIELYNSLFGRRVFFIIAYILVNTLESLDFFLFQPTTSSYSTNINVKIYCLTLTCTWMVNFPFKLLQSQTCNNIFQIMYSYIFYLCSGINEEIKKIGLLCERLAKDLPKNSKFSVELKCLQYEYDNGCTQLSAWGVFDLNKANFFGLLGSLASWIVIIAQMIK